MELSAKPSNTTMSAKLFLVAISLSLLVFGGCSKKSGSAIQNSNKVRVGYIGLTCEAPIYAAYEKGFFKEEGLEAELVKCSWSTYKDALALGSYDITHHLVMYFLKPIEQGLDVRFLAGIHRGCLHARLHAQTSPMNSGKESYVQTLFDRLEKIHHQMMSDVIAAQRQCVLVSCPIALH